MVGRKQLSPKLPEKQKTVKSLQIFESVHFGFTFCVPSLLRACRAAEVCVCRLAGDCIRGRERAGGVQCDGGVCPERAAMHDASCSEPRSH